MDFDHLFKCFDAFRTKLERLKKEIGSAEFSWYPYDTLSNIVHLNRLLSPQFRDISKLAGKLPVLDLGCGDGDMAFFLESLGFKVVAVDNPWTSHNHMQGIRLLKERLGSSVEIHELDIDGRFELPNREYGLALMLGVLYHLKNPLYALETLAKHTRYCILSTRVAKLLPDRKTNIQKVPVAYLVDYDELNNDITNFWIFSSAGLMRLVSRAGWQIMDSVMVGDVKASDPLRPDHDERTFYLVASERNMAHLELVSGWHDAQPEGWRWTESEFVARTKALGRPARSIVLEYYVTELSIQKFSAVTLTVQANGAIVGRETCKTPGSKRGVWRLPKELRGDVEIRCTVDGIFPAGELDDREMGITVGNLLLR